jgi:apolipoprotein N-acyltransferase
MCCFITTLAFLGPRLGLMVFWLFPYGALKINAAFQGWFWPLLGWIFVPWTTLMYVLVFPIGGFDWLWLGLAVIADLGMYGGGAYGNRGRFPG